MAERNQKCDYCLGMGTVSGQVPLITCPQCSGTGYQPKPVQDGPEGFQKSFNDWADDGIETIANNLSEAEIYIEAKKKVAEILAAIQAAGMKCTSVNGWACNYQPKPEAGKPDKLALKTELDRIFKLPIGCSVYPCHKSPCENCKKEQILSAIQSAGYKSPEEVKKLVDNAYQRGFYMKPEPDGIYDNGFRDGVRETESKFAGYVLLAEKQEAPDPSIAVFTKAGIKTGSTKFFDQLTTPILNPDGTYRVWAAITVTKEQLERIRKE